MNELLHRVRRSGVSVAAVADVLIRIYGFDAETAARIVAAEPERRTKKS